ncbi:hypothetical protein ACHAXA_008409 [Cyclostephanos tholiformis]|uniref:Uncharacterized protein n=1 Tax=Cyclostephanos tholiformis TaxID=382380 RepID=A0ABD3R4V6_9STRA
MELSSSSGGGRWIHNPLAPTPQLLSYIRESSSIHGPATFGPFAQYFPDATVWIQRVQWSFPIQLPIEYLGVVQGNNKLPSSQYLYGTRSLDDELKLISEGGGGRNARYWAKKSPIPEWTADIDYKTLHPLFSGAPRGCSLSPMPFAASRPPPPPIVIEDTRALLYHSRDSIFDDVVDDEATRKKGWRRMVQ